MQIKLRGEMTLAEIRQALFEKLHEIETDYAVRYSRGATLYINPTNEFGEDVVARKSTGEIVKTVFSNGPYKPAADEYKP